MSELRSLYVIEEEARAIGKACWLNHNQGHPRLVEKVMTGRSR